MMFFCGSKIKIIALFVVFVVLLGCCSCQRNVWEKTTEVQVVSHFDAEKERVVLSASRCEYIVSVWNDAEWEKDVTKTASEYSFFCGEAEIRYSQAYGIFNDLEGQRHFTVSEEERLTINSMLEDALAQAPASDANF